MHKNLTLAERNNFIKGSGLSAHPLLMGFFYALTDQRSGVFPRLVAVMATLSFLWLFRSGSESTALLLSTKFISHARQPKQTIYHCSATERGGTRAAIARLPKTASLLPQKQGNYGSIYLQHEGSRQRQHFYRSAHQPERTSKVLPNLVPNGSLGADYYIGLYKQLALLVSQIGVTQKYIAQNLRTT